MDDFDIAQSKIGESAQRVVDRAIEESRRRDHTLLTNEHIFLAFAQVEWDAFSQVMRDLELNPHEILRAIDGHLSVLPTHVNRELRVAPAAKLAFKLAFHSASRGGRHSIESSDLIEAIFQESQGASVSVMRRYGVEPEVVVARIANRVREIEMREERLRKMFELPPFLKHFAVSLNLEARKNKIHKAFGRDKEIMQVIEILSHRQRANSPLLLGEPGVGKTAVAEGLAWKIEYEPETIPVRIRDCHVVFLAMNTMVAGTMLRGMFEDRIQNVIREVKERPNMILFVDEVHTMIGAGSALGAPNDAATIFKSVMARGEVRIIGATTLGEYKVHIAEDEALARRFRVVKVNEPTVSETREMIQMLRPRLERNYSVRITQEAIDAALELSARYQRHLRMPDKPIGWLDTACVRVEMRRDFEVTAGEVVNVVAGACDIPVDMVYRDVGSRFDNIESKLQRRVIGQSHAIKAVADRLFLNKGLLKDGFDRPDGVLLFLGPTGVGKTELAKALAEFLFGDEKKMIRIDMSEYQELSSVDRLIGQPRGIVGSEQGGLLTNQLRDNPNSVVLLDEIEKANPFVLNLFLQAFDEGWLTDGRGRRSYFSDAVVIMTSNLGSAHFRKLTSNLGFRQGQTPIADIKKLVSADLERAFSPEFRNRIDSVVIFEPLTLDEVIEIAEIRLFKIKDALNEAKKDLAWTREALEVLAREGHSTENGARFLKRVIEDKVSIPISRQMRTHGRFKLVAEEGGLQLKDTDEISSAEPAYG